MPTPSPVLPPYGVYTEFGRAAVAAQPGTNVRRFNFINQQGGTSIFYDEASAVLALGPGTYRISGYSITTFGYDLTPEQQKKAFSAPGYAFLWNVDTNAMVITGSMQDPLYSLASHVDEILTVTQTTRFSFCHQNGNKVDGVMLDTYVPQITTSTNHVFARLVVERIDRA
jgi:hypothetical protein